MRAKGTWVTLFFLLSAIVVAMGLHFAIRDVFLWLNVDNIAIAGDGVRLSTVLGLGIALCLAVYFGIFNNKSRNYIEQCVIEFDKVAWPTWADTKVTTFTVIVTSFIASIILGVFDTVFSWLTRNNLFIW